MAYTRLAVVSCLRLLMLTAFHAAILACKTKGNDKVASKVMMPMATKSSVSVNPWDVFSCFNCCFIDSKTKGGVLHRAGVLKNGGIVSASP